MSTINEGMTGGAAGGGDAKVVLTKNPEDYQCVEIYLPKRLDYLSCLYAHLAQELKNGHDALPVTGFSIYEADGAWSGWGENCDERTLVIRILFQRPEKDADILLETRVKEMGERLADIANKEKQIMVCSYVQKVTMFEPIRPNQAQGG